MKSQGASVAARELLRTLEEARAKREARTTDLRRDMVELNVLRAFGAAVNDGLDREHIVLAMKEHVPRLFDYDVLTLLVDFGEPEMFVFPGEEVEEAFVRAAASLVLDADGAVRGRDLSIDNVRLIVERPVSPPGGAPDRAAGKAGAAEIGSHVSLPLVSGGEHTGFLSIAARRRDAFGPVDVQLLSLICYQLSAAFRNAALFAKTRELAVKDGLTGLFNRRHFDERLAEEHRRARRYNHAMAVIVSDIDHFKSINDRFGHVTGDAVIRAVAAALKQGTRASDTLCRYGGEEFAIILPETSIEEAALVAERCRALVAEHAGTDGGLKEPVRMSFGVSGSAGNEALPPVDSLVRQADGALYLAKRSGRNRVCASLAEGSAPRPRELADHEKRRFPRFDTKLPLRYLVVPDLGKGAPSARSLDMSPQGLRVSVDQAVPEGAFILLELDDEGAEPIRLLSKVVWSTPEGEGGATLGTRIVAVEGETRYAALLGQSVHPQRDDSRPKAKKSGGKPVAKKALARTKKR